MKRKFRTLVITYAVAGVAVLGGLAWTSHIEAESYKRELIYHQRHAFAEVVTGISEIDTALQKSLYATSPSMMASVCTEVFGKAMSAQMAMGILPFSDYELSETSSFIAKVGDYAYMLSKTSAGGTAFTEEQHKNLAALSAAATELSYNMNQLLADMDDGVISISELEAAQNSAGETASMLGSSIQTMESEFPEIPSLIYDGPFSEHIAQMKPVYLEGMEEADELAALSAAADFTGLRDSVFEIYGERGGSVPVYMVSALVDGGEMSLEVTKQGGLVIDMLNSRQVSSASLTAEQAVEKASAFLEKAGYSNMSESYYMVEENVCTVNFAFTQDDVVCYTDLIKVAIALDDGSVVGFEALGYFMSHTERDIPKAEVSEDKAREKVSPELEVLSHQMTVIPTNGKYETFCHEFKCQTQDGRHYIVYVNALTGAEEKILILLESENGTLAI